MGDQPAHLQIERKTLLRRREDEPAAEVDAEPGLGVAAARLPPLASFVASDAVRVRRASPFTASASQPSGGGVSTSPRIPAAPMAIMRSAVKGPSVSPPGVSLSPPAP